MSDERTLESQCYGECWAAKEEIADKDAQLRRLHADNERLKGLLREARDSVWSVNDFGLLERIDAALQEDKT